VLTANFDCPSTNKGCVRKKSRGAKSQLAGRSVIAARFIAEDLTEGRGGGGGGGGKNQPKTNQKKKKKNTKKNHNPKQRTAYEKKERRKTHIRRIIYQWAYVKSEDPDRKSQEPRGDNKKKRHLEKKDTEPRIAHMAKATGSRKPKKKKRRRFWAVHTRKVTRPPGIGARKRR